MPSCRRVGVGARRVGRLDDPPPGDPQLLRPRLRHVALACGRLGAARFGRWVRAAAPRERPTQSNFERDLLAQLTQRWSKRVAVKKDELDLDDLKWVVLMVLFNQPGSEAAYAWMETQMFMDEPEPLH